MGILIEQQAVIDCLTNTAKYYDMPQSDKWTKGIIKMNDVSIDGYKGWAESEEV